MLTNWNQADPSVEQTILVHQTWKMMAVIAVWALVFSSYSWGQSVREYIYLDGRLIAVETACDVTLSDYSANVLAEGVQWTSVSVTGNCTWIAESNNPDWISVQNISGAFRYSVAANSSTSPRSGTISVGSRTFVSGKRGASIPGVDY